VKFREGISFPLVDKVFGIIKENERLLFVKRESKKKFAAPMRKDNPFNNDAMMIKVLFDDYDNYNEDVD